MIATGSLLIEGKTLVKRAKKSIKYMVQYSFALTVSKSYKMSVDIPLDIPLDIPYLSENRLTGLRILVEKR
ncbi:hypothetical protein GCM10007332_06060 [Epilithonimonas arachidiradicis]|uniref:Uncharacterized protein n=1 Tax=Epilithonimonas arachidiradicis TaxID=1617282 RepID=A0ABQ1WW07_9FLAO|nr:hypothetical protein GCM10007332_06060 [Epilithonimonas arachidiradicis]